MVEWSLVRPAMEQHLIFPVISLMTQLIEENESVIRQLQAKLNQRIGSNPERDQRIVELYKQGLSRGQIAREVEMSKWGVSKALRRLGVNSVVTD